MQKTREIEAVILIRDLDNQPERREGLEQARLEDANRQPKLAIVIGTADRMREAWVLNGFMPLDEAEKEVLEEIKTQLNFDPCEESHRLRSNSREEGDRARNPKVVLEKLTGENFDRERICWEETSLELLRKRGVDTGLTDYMNEIEERLAPLLSSD